MYTHRYCILRSHPTLTKTYSLDVNFADEAFVTENGKQSKRWHRLCYIAKLLLCQLRCRLHVECWMWMVCKICVLGAVVYLRLSPLNYWRMTLEENTSGILYWSSRNHNPHIFIVLRSSFHFAIVAVAVAVGFFCNRIRKQRSKTSALKSLDTSNGYKFPSHRQIHLSIPFKSFDTN